jgi:hypothetical protein
VIWWWESRRPAYNALVGLAGPASCIAALLLYMVAPGDADEADGSFLQLVAIVAYAVMANLLYTGGWLLELGLRLARRPAAPEFASALFRNGTLFSIGLTLVPGVVVLVLLAVEFVRRVAG